MALNEPLVDPKAQPFPPERKDVVLAIGLAAFAALYVIACFVGGSYGSAFFSIPFFVAFAVGALNPQRPYATSFAVLGLGLLLAILTLREGVVCVIFALPVLSPMLMIGAFSGATLAKQARYRRHRDGLIGLVLLVGAGWQAEAGLSDEPLRHPLHSASASISIDAAPEVVFAALTAPELRVAPRWPWFLRIGLPMPERLSVDRPGPDGRLHFDFSQGTAFARVTAWDPPRTLAYAVTHYEIHDLPFHITRLGRSPDYGFRKERVQDWLSVESTRYELVPTDDGKTELRRSIVWRRHLAPDLYFGWLQQAVIERGQVRLLELVREEVERRAPQNHSKPQKTAGLW